MIASVKNELTFISTTEHATTAAAIAALERETPLTSFHRASLTAVWVHQGRFDPTRGVKRWSLLTGKQGGFAYTSPHFRG